MMNGGKRNPDFSGEPAPEPVTGIGDDTAEHGETAAARLMIAHAWINAQTRRNIIMGADLFVSPAWDMLLDLYIALRGGRRVAVSDLCVASHVPQATAIRWIGVLQARDLVEKIPDPNDRRRHFVELTPTALVLLERSLDAAADSDRKIGLERLRILK